MNLAQPRHVLDVAIGEVRPHETRCFMPGLSTSFSGSISSLVELRVVRLRRRRPFGDPADEHVVFRRADLEPHAPFVRNRGRRLGDQQAAAGSSGTIRRPRACRVIVN